MTFSTARLRFGTVNKGDGRMTMQAQNGDGRRGASWWRLLPWGGASALLAAPAVAMRLGADVDWTAFDFIVAGLMLAVPLAVFELALRASGSLAYRAGVVVALGVAILITWSNLAVGIIGSENDPINLMFFGVIFVAIAGAFLASFRAKGLAVAMTATAAAQALTAVVALVGGHFEFVIIGVFTTGWLMSAWLFRKAAEAEGRATSS